MQGSCQVNHGRKRNLERCAPCDAALLLGSDNRQLLIRTPEQGFEKPTRWTSDDSGTISIRKDTLLCSQVRRRCRKSTLLPHFAAHHRATHECAILRASDLLDAAVCCEEISDAIPIFRMAVSLSRLVGALRAHRAEVLTSSHYPGEPAEMPGMLEPGLLEQRPWGGFKQSVGAHEGVKRRHAMRVT